MEVGKGGVWEVPCTRMGLETCSPLDSIRAPHGSLCGGLRTTSPILGLSKSADIFFFSGPVLET